MDLTRLLLSEGEIPRRPPFLVRPADDLASTTELAEHLLSTRRTVVLGGVSLLGLEGFIARIVTIVRIEQRSLIGWTLMLGYPDRSVEFRHFDAANTLPLDEVLPVSLVYFVGLTDRRMALMDAPEDDRIAIARFVIPFIADDGQSVGIEW